MKDLKRSIAVLCSQLRLGGNPETSQGAGFKFKVTGMSSLWPWSSCYFPPLGVTMLASSDGTVRVYNGQTGFLDKETNLVTSSVDNCMCGY